jgi:hypothetical protein
VTVASNEGSFYGVTRSRSFQRTSVFSTRFGLPIVTEMFDCSAASTSAYARTPTVLSFLRPNIRPNPCQRLLNCTAIGAAPGAPTGPVGSAQ